MSLDMSQNSKHDLDQVLGTDCGTKKLSIESRPSCAALEKLSYEWREECNDDAKFCWRIAGEESNADVLRAVYGVDPAIGVNYSS